MCWNVERDIYKVCTKVLFHCSNISTGCPLSYNRVNLKSKNCKIWGFHSVKTCQPAKHPGRPVSSQQALMLAAPSARAHVVLRQRHATRQKFWQALLWSLEGEGRRILRNVGNTLPLTQTHRRLKRATVKVSQLAPLRLLCLITLLHGQWCQWVKQSKLVVLLDPEDEGSVRLRNVIRQSTQCTS
jgi:hypothetical protein